MFVATALTVYGIETMYRHLLISNCIFVATALTVYGIETFQVNLASLTTTAVLQQHLPFTVLKQNRRYIIMNGKLVATALTVYGIET